MVDVFRCRRAAVYHNTRRLTPGRIQAETGCTHVLNGGFFVSDPASPRYFTPLSWLVVEGKVVSQDEFNDWGFGCGADGAPAMTTHRTESHLYLVPLLKDGKRLSRSLSADVARPAQRSAVGWLADGRIALLCGGGTMTREQTQDRLLALGCVDGLMCDGGGSAQCVFPGGTVQSGRLVPTYLLFWAEDEKKEESGMEKRRVCLDAGHDGGNTANASPDGAFLEHEFALDMARRIKLLLEQAGVSVTLTRDGGGAVSLGERCRISNGAAAELFVSLHSNAAAGGGWSNARGWECYVYGLSGNRYAAAKAILRRVEGVAKAIRSTPIRERPDLYVLKHTASPAVLIEHGFHTNVEDVLAMRDGAYRQRLAEAETAGILDYLGLSVPEWGGEAGEQSGGTQAGEQAENAGGESSAGGEAGKTEAQQAVDWAVEKGIMQGDGNGNLMLKQPVTRQQLATMLWRYHRLRED